MTERKAFNFYRSYYDMLLKLSSQKDREEFLSAIISAQFTGEISEPKRPMAALAFSAVKHSIERQLVGFETGIKGGRPLGGSDNAPYNAPQNGPLPQEQVQGKVQGKGKEYDPLAIEVLAEFNRITGREFKNSKNSLHPIQARLREGFTKEQAVLVIESKFKEWGTDVKMQQYVRPETIFNGKFDSYLQAANALKPKVKKHNFGAFNNKADYLFWCKEIVKEQPQEWEE